MNTVSIDFSAPFLQLGQQWFSLGEFFLAGAIALLFMAAFLIIRSWRASNLKRHQNLINAERVRKSEQSMAELVASQNELTGRLAAMTEGISAQSASLSKRMDERLAGMSGQLGQSITATTKSTQESLAKLQERLAVIDDAQKNITSLTGQVVELQNILDNKQTRGAFGQSRMEIIVQDGLPLGTYKFQATLSNNKRPDCLIIMPNNAPALVIDAKFPLEAWSAIQDAQTTESTKSATAQFRRDMDVHIKAISEKYLIAGETQDTAFMFVPSESIFAEIHEKFEGIVQKAHKARVVIVSPSLLLLSIQVIQALLKDARMQEQAHLIQDEVSKLMEDMARLDERVRKLQNHFNLTAADIDQILISTGKLTRHGDRIEALEFAATGGADTEIENSPPSSRLILRAID
jgi:DNA recombination protein RmuC